MQFVSTVRCLPLLCDCKYSQCKLLLIDMRWMGGWGILGTGKLKDTEKETMLTLI